MKKLIPKFIGFYFNLLTLAAPSLGGRKGFFFFCTPFGAKIKAHQLSFLNTAEQINYPFENTTIKIYKWGSGKNRLLFLHGWQSHSFRWKNYINVLSKEDYTIYAIDAPAHGQSGGQYLNAVVYSRLLEKFVTDTGPIDTIVSHSLGSMTALYTLHRLPAFPVQKVIITGMPSEVNDFIRFYQGVLGLWNSTMNVIRSSFEREIGHLPEYFSMPVMAKELTTPCLLIHDRTDPDAPYHKVQEVHQNWKNSELMTTESLGHNLRSPAVVQAVHDFIIRKEAVLA